MKKIEKDKETPYGRISSVRYDRYAATRMNMAKKQLNLSRKQGKEFDDMLNDIVECVNNFLTSYGMKTMVQLDYNPKVKPNEINYQEIKKMYNLKDIRDFVWIKFAKEKNDEVKFRHIGVVACSNDVGFDFPKSKEDYSDKKHYTSSGIILHRLNELYWDESVVLLFPLKDIPEGFSRGDIETGIGNELLGNGFYIIDYYSHNY